MWAYGARIRIYYVLYLKHIAPLEACFPGPPLVRGKPLGASLFLKRDHNANFLNWFEKQIKLLICIKYSIQDDHPKYFTVISQPLWQGQMNSYNKIILFKKNNKNNSDWTA